MTSKRWLALFLLAAAAAWFAGARAASPALNASLAPLGNRSFPRAANPAARFSRGSVGLASAGAGEAAQASAAAKGPVQPTWESIKAHYQVPQWFRDAKFGIFLHWGVYAVPAHQSEWYVRHMYGNPGITQWHQEHFGPPDKFGYKDFIPLCTLFLA